MEPQKLKDYMMFTKWYAMPDDLIGSWCIMTTPAPPSQSKGTQVADFIDELFAIHIAALHNSWLTLMERDGKIPPEQQVTADTQVIAVVKPLDQTQEFEPMDDHSEYY